MAAQSIKSLFNFCFCEAFIKNLMEKKQHIFVIKISKIQFKMYYVMEC